MRTTASIISRKSSVSPAAFSLVEIMVVVGLLSVIIIGLLSMFTQTQRAFRLGMTQVDVLEAGRAATDMIARELEQVAPADQPVINPCPNFYVQQVPNYSHVFQLLPGSNVPRENLVEDVFFLYRQNQDWWGVGYFVRTNGGPPPGSLGVSPVGVGTLYRFETSINTALNPNAFTNLFGAFNAARANGAPAFGTNGLARVMDGVVDFRVRVFDTNSFAIGFPMRWSADGRGILFSTNGMLNIPTSYTTPPTNAAIVFSPYGTPDAVQLYSFTSNAVPVAVELEIGILEQRALERFKALTDPGAQRFYLTNQDANVVGKVHLFRQRVPIRAADLTAYQ